MSTWAGGHESVAASVLPLLARLVALSADALPGSNVVARETKDTALSAMLCGGQLAGWGGT